MKTRILYSVIIGLFAVLQGCSGPAKTEASQSPAPGGAAPTDEIEKYRAMIADGNLADLYEAAGEDLWK